MPFEVSVGLADLTAYAELKGVHRLTGRIVGGDKTIKALTGENKDYDDQLEAITEARLKEKEKAIQKTFDQKEQLLQQAQLTLSNKLGEAETKVVTLHSALESAQAEVLELKSKYNEVEKTKCNEMEMVIKDLQSAKERTESSEREVEQLRQQLASATQNLHQVEEMEKATDMEQAVDVLKQSRLEVELAAKDKEISQLVEDIQKLQATYSSLQESTSARISKLELAISRKNKAFHLLELKLKSKEEFEELQQNLSSMKSSEFTELCDDEEPSSPTSERSLEMLLLLDKAKSEHRSTPTQQQDSDSQPLNLTESENSVNNTNSNTLANTEAFSTMLGEQSVTSHQQHNSSGPGNPSTPTSNGLPPPPPPLPVENHPPPPSPHNNNNSNTSNHVPFSPPPATTTTTTTTNCQMPPPSSSSSSSQSSQSSQSSSQQSSQQFLSYGNGHSPTSHHHHHHHYMPPSVVVKQEQGVGAAANSSNGKNQTLDTSGVAKTIREVLSMHNIGQRLFAKEVLGLSQGTVSELLSKPKSWDKLTEKGRESYRKMHAWCADESNILALKAISPKKSKFAS
ncbi:cut-like 1 isoform X3 [Octopus vulgaris]|uniref:Cut-like 1 isoform X3 n=1 Tax=Octopus vulgaris TaxID=6645 RepID=A0AA36C1N9_OCTVU|nr:cut-like 1 isoform X3 [Octopus vulgaris]